MYIGSDDRKVYAFDLAAGHTKQRHERLAVFQRRTVDFLG
jgi:hypothetical protein